MISRLSLTNFRNYVQQSFVLDNDVTLVVGPNGSGKTNLLEALYVLSSTRSFRARDGELIRHGQQHFRVEAEVGGEELAFAYEEQVGSSRKQATRDGVKRPLVAHVGSVPVVLFEPNDLLLVYGSPDRRRRHLDHILSQTDREYVQALHKYRRTLAQRNRLLGDWSGDTGQLFAWNIKLAEHGSTILAKRRELVNYFNERIGELYGDIAGTPEPLELEYQPTVSGGEDASQFMAGLEQSQGRDTGAGFTTIGPHRDDAALRFRDTDIEAEASRGEIRTAVLALKMAELQYVGERTATSPLLLLDDVFSELDAQRRSYLVKRLAGHQSIITTTNADSVIADFGAAHGLIETARLTIDKQSA